jgi:hypothetical protein
VQCGVIEKLGDGGHVGGLGTCGLLHGDGADSCFEHGDVDRASVVEKVA